MRTLRRTHGIAVACLQETQLGLTSSTSIKIQDFWGNSNCDFEVIEATGRSEGLLTIWDNQQFTVTKIIRSRFFLIVIGPCIDSSGDLAIVNVYAPQSATMKKKLWDELSLIKANRNARWIIMGDFNVVRRQTERVNSRFCPNSVDDFNQFINNNSLQDLRMGDFNFTYYRQEGRKTSTSRTTGRKEES